MTIHRVGPLPTPGRVQLGRVLVTIDDLAALIDIVRQQATDPASVAMRFSGGYFTDPQDLQQLSDDEITSVTVESDNVAVILAPTGAVAVGDDAARATIQNVWARTRQTTQGIWKSAAEEISASSVGGAVLLAGIAIVMIVDPDPQWPEWQRWLNPVVAFAFSIGLVAASFRTALREVRSQSHALIRPMSRHEFRQLQSNNQYPRLGWIVAIVAAVIAGLGVGATLLAPFITPHT